MKDVWAVLTRQRDYRLLLGAGLVSLTGDWILRTGLAFRVYELTGSTLTSGGLLLASFVPTVVLGSVAGVFADRWDRRRAMIVLNLLHVIALLPLLAVHDRRTIGIVYAVVLAQSCLQQFFVPAEQSLLPALTEPGQLLTANALNSQTRDVARLLGGALGGVLAAAGGIPLLATADAGTFVAALVLVSSIRHRAGRAPAVRGAAERAAPGVRAEPGRGSRPRIRTGEALARLAEEWKDGLRLCAAGRAMRLVFLFGLVTQIGEGLMSTLFAPFVRTELGGGAQAYGLIVSSQAVGGIVGGLVAAAAGSRLPAVTMWGTGSVLFGLVDLTLFCSPLATDSLVPAFVCMILVGVPGAFTVAGSMTVLQRLAEDGARGRVLGALSAVEGAAVLAGITVAGLLGNVVGTIPLLVLQALGYVLGGIVVLAQRRLLGAERPEREAAAQPA
ncbi:MFS transporter [Actinacidiphila rubida]|uniref:Major Facilitator Superfamily protein n=1 Tax=Actinacidiphila rubida TaxID=310780 RepID=A0A1H8S018_9ACTN|nr:MFS transporter [Actinacidiphila rubida]SEO72031.1 Major Facilitator Superfamily protein [Actinacidiphila rubida]